MGNRPQIHKKLHGRIQGGGWLGAPPPLDALNFAKKVEK